MIDDKKDSELWQFVLSVFLFNSINSKDVGHQISMSLIDIRERWEKSCQWRMPWQFEPKKDACMSAIPTVSPPTGATNRWFPNGVIPLVAISETLNHALALRYRGGTRGTETSKYPEEKKSYRDSVSSGERKRISLNPRRKSGVLRDCNIRLNICKRMNWKVQPKKVKALYLTRMFTVAVSQVPRDTENLVGIWVGHDPRLKTQTDR